MKNSNITLSIFLIFLTLQFTMMFSKVFSQSQWEQTTIQGVANSYVVDVDFINSNTGFIAVKEIDTMKIFKTTNKGLTFNQFWSLINNGFEFGISFNNADTGFVFFDDDVYKIWGNNHQSRVIDNPWNPSKHRIKIFENGIGYCLYGTTISTNGYCYAKIYKTINFGSDWSLVYDAIYNGDEAKLSDVDILKSNPDSVIVVGQIRGLDGFHPQSRSAIRITSSNGFDSSYYINSIANVNDSIAFDFVNFLPNGESRILANDGIYNQSLTKIYNITEAGLFTTQYGFRFINNNLGLASLNSGQIIQSTNGGYNWSVVSNIGYGNFTSSQISSIGEIAYYGDATFRNLFTRRLNTDLKTYFDNQSSSYSFSIDGNTINTPTTTYLRGGTSSLASANIINTGQTNERIFCKWSDGYMYSVHNEGESNGHDFYFDMSGTTIANYYKTKQLSTSSASISNASQTKSIRDTTINNVTTTHTIHESMGGIFYSKSTNFGATYQIEEVVNLSDNTAAVNGNKNAYLTIMRASGGLYPITTSDVNRNVAVVWEKYNSATQQTEIKFAHRILNDQQDGYEWKTYDITSFSAPSGFESKPKCFVTVSPGQTQEGPFLIIVPHLRPNGGQNKIFTSVRYNSQSQDYELENGYIQDLAVTSPFNYYSSYIVHFAYLKDDKVAYRREEFGYNNGNIYRGTSPPPEVNNNISFGDGYASRYKPDISLMNGIPVVSYSANYNANAMIDYESGGTDIIQISRYPVIKVERKGINDWGDYIIYNSVNVQGNPDIEGSADTKSYLINYSAGNGLFKKVVNVESHPGYFCDPNTFSGTDSRLIKNSYTGYFGNSLSLLTLSPNAGLYKLDKQNFNITNIVTADAYDNLGGVINLDTVRYSFNLGPLLIKEPNDDIEEISFDPKYTPPAPVMTPVEFNQNLRSNPFLLNESQALLVGCNVTYLKDDIDAVINEVRYSVDLMNKSTDSLHRVLYSDTIHADDSIATEYLRGYYITGIPNGEDSFYVKITVNNEDIAEGNFNINPGYDDNSGAGDNSSGYNTKIIFENSVVENTTNIILGEYSLEQNYPNPFNPTTNLEFGISDLGFVSLKVYDLLGKEVRTLVNEIKPPGIYNVEFDGSNLASGIYFYKLEAGSYVQTKRMLLLK